MECSPLSFRVPNDDEFYNNPVIRVNMRISLEERALRCFDAGTVRDPAGGFLRSMQSNAKVASIGDVLSAYDMHLALCWNLPGESCTLSISKIQLDNLTSQQALILLVVSKLFSERTKFATLHGLRTCMFSGGGGSHSNFRKDDFCLCL